jgi:hypothetical protein
MLDSFFLVKERKNIRTLEQTFFFHLHPQATGFLGASLGGLETSVRLGVSETQGQVRSHHTRLPVCHSPPCRFERDRQLWRKPAALARRIGGPVERRGWFRELGYKMQIDMHAQLRGSLLYWCWWSVRHVRQV